MKNFLLFLLNVSQWLGRSRPGGRLRTRGSAPPILVGCLLMAGALAAADTPFWVSPCDDPETGCKASDPDLARWALASWETASGGRLHFVETKDRSKALIRMVWASQTGGLYGETVAIDVNGRHGSQIYIVNTTQGIKDDLLRIPLCISPACMNPATPWVCSIPINSRTLCFILAMAATSTNTSADTAASFLYARTSQELRPVAGRPGAFDGEAAFV